MQNFRFSAVLDGGRASHQPDDPQLISYGSCGRSVAVRGISSVLQYRGIVKNAQKDCPYNKSILNESANYTNIIDQDEGVLPERKFR